MKSLGKIEPQYKNSAHHIVMSNSKNDKMQKLRQKMKSLGIEINSAENGVYLPTFYESKS